MVDSGASMHVLSKKDSNSAEMENSANFQNSSDGCNSQSRGANKKGSDSVCHGTGVVRDIEAPRRYTDGALAWKTPRRTRIFLRADQRSISTSH